ncbi:MAG: hypothetical protein ACXVEE_34475 [Polyangiales bacterium]
MKRFEDPEERRKMAETLRLAAEAIEAGHGETFDIRVEPHHDELHAGRFVAMKKTGAVRVFLNVSFVAGANLRGRITE